MKKDYKKNYEHWFKEKDETMQEFCISRIQGLKNVLWEIDYKQNQNICKQIETLYLFDDFLTFF